MRGASISTLRVVLRVPRVLRVNRQVQQSLRCRSLDSLRSLGMTGAPLTVSASSPSSVRSPEQQVVLDYAIILDWSAQRGRHAIARPEVAVGALDHGAHDRKDAA